MTESLYEEPIFLVGKRLCAICRRYRHTDETIHFQKPRGSKSAMPWHVCIICFERRRREVVELVGQQEVERVVRGK